METGESGRGGSSRMGARMGRGGKRLVVGENELEVCCIEGGDGWKEVRVGWLSGVPISMVVFRGEAVHTARPTAAGSGISPWGT